jgi:hypothetical protein
LKRNTHGLLIPPPNANTLLMDLDSIIIDNFEVNKDQILQRYNIFAKKFWKRESTLKAFKSNLTAYLERIQFDV